MVCKKHSKRKEVSSSEDDGDKEESTSSPEEELPPKKKRSKKQTSLFGEDEQRPGDKNVVEYFFERNRQERMFANIPKAKFTLSFVYLSEANIAHILYSGNASTVAVAKRVLKNSSAIVAEIAVDLCKDYLLKLRGTICTNGLQLNLLAYDTTAPRRRSTQAPASQNDDDLADLLDVEGIDFKLNEVFLGSVEEGNDE
ncbi:hypothetical protein EDD11_005084 [Mortierella claussenii]|nr:hypothetical protein EDD11_005084 [Mortierella claussenii]